MIKANEWQGTWLIIMPDGTELTFVGVLSYNVSEGCILKASTSQYSDNFLNYISNISRIEIINGYENVSHKGLILKKCTITNALQSNGLFITASISEVIESSSYEEELTLSFNKVILEYSAFGKWLRSKEIETKIHDPHDPSILFSFIYKEPKLLIFDINDKIELKILFGYSVNRENENNVGLFFTQTCNINIVSKVGQLTDNEFDKYNEQFRRLVGIFYYQHCFVLSHRYLVDQNHNYFIKYYKQNSFDRVSNYPSSSGAIVRFNEVEHILVEIFQKGFKYQESDDWTYVAYISAKNLSNFSEETFLENARALEVYHKIKNAGKIHFRARVKSLLDNVRAITDANDFDHYFPDIDRFIHLIVTNRNYLTHYGAGTIQGVDKLEIEELLWLTRQCKVVLLTSIYENLGIDTKSAFRKLKDRHRKVSN